MKEETEAALRGILRLDPEIAAEDVERAVGYLRGERGEGELVRVLKYKDVMSLLHIHRRTLEYYIARGYLVRVFGGGKRARHLPRQLHPLHHHPPRRAVKRNSPPPPCARTSDFAKIPTSKPR